MSFSASNAMDHWPEFDFHALEQRILARLRQDRRVPWFVLASVLLHAAIVLFAAAPAWLKPEPQEAPPLSVKLQAPKPPPPVVTPKPPPPPTTQSTPVRREQPPPPQPMPMVQPLASAPNAPAIAAREEPPPPPREIPVAPPPVVPPPAPRVIDDSAALGEYSRRLTEMVGRNKQYPAIARMRGWQGTTELELKLTPDGRLLGSRVLSSSGHEVLDRQALEMVEQIGQFPAFPQPRDQPLTLRLPVIFKLAAQ